MKTPNSTARIEARTARRLGRNAFYLACCIQMVLMVVFFFSFQWIAYVTDLFGHRRGDESYFDYLGNELHTENVIVGFGMAAIVYVLLGGAFGSWAGRRIITDGKPFGWVGLVTLLLPAAFATIFGLNAVSLYVEGNLFFHARNFQHNVVEPSVILFLVLYPPGIVFGILAGLWTRQAGRRSLEASQSPMP